MRGLSVIMVLMTCGSEAFVRQFARRTDGYLDRLGRPSLSYLDRLRRRAPVNITADPVIVITTTDGIMNSSSASVEPERLDPSVWRQLQLSKMNRRSSTGSFRIETATKNMTFADIGGYSGLKSELTQVIDFMKNPERYESYNVRLPRGILLHGEPGTGKTLMAKCLAGECDLPFIPTSGSEFQEKYVGTGASRVRELFEFARSNQPCMVYIDEVDGLARRRGTDGDNAQAERDQTLNQLLVELDGFRENKGVLVIGSTNRVDILDDAFMRPGRLDKVFYVTLPDYDARVEIIRIHMRGKPINASIDEIAVITQGMTGAQIESILNEASLHGIRKDELPVGSDIIELYKDIVSLGGKSTNAGRGRLSPDVLHRIAVHEAGHALTAVLLPLHPDPIKVTISSPSMRSLGFTQFGGSSDSDHEGSSLITRDHLMDHMAVLLGGRIAEELVFGPSGVTPGAVDDIKKCKEIAKRMVIEFGMGRQILHPINSDKSRHDADLEVIAIIRKVYQDARRILENNRLTLNAIVDALHDRHTLYYEDLASIIHDHD